MKKRTMVLGGLIAAVAITGYSVAGTYAKYISESTTTDSARIAQWHLNSLNDIDLFAASYSDTDANATSLEGDKIIAPGTSGEYTFTLSGTFETEYTLALEVLTADSHGILFDGYNDPVIYKLAKDGKEVTNGWVDFDSLVDALEGIGENGKVYSPGELDETEYTISWKWAFSKSDPDAPSYQNDTDDTILGNAIALAFMSSSERATYLANKQNELTEITKAYQAADSGSKKEKLLEAQMDAISDEIALINKINANTKEDLTVRLTIKVSAEQYSGSYNS